ncbi:MAG: RNA polymerase sigma factor [Candidatus Gottesmanbacteria bacterium GW2011_GWB1_49_7]|uniref:RNA polymerase sigma factor n=1 Tax=Candidatus Gottesmanbacteria bacterium GW2011_GWB1_49_7 TaxID=1618448 RepID=A0A0G1VVA4_9BACT|nr:MAG: RNA polymerase sigma factor [Candidatus Gottesmanbacteria bacterium GW2011_GWB1_49_7]
MTEETAPKGPTRKEQRDKLMEGVKNAIERSGHAGITAPGIAKVLNLLSGDAEKDKEVLHEMRAVARAVVKKNGWSRINRDGRQKLYQAITDDEAKKQLAAADAVRAEKVVKARTERKSKRASKEASDDEEEDSDEEDSDEEDSEDEEDDSEDDD